MPLWWFMIGQQQATHTILVKRKSSSINYNISFSLSLSLLKQSGSYSILALPDKSVKITIPQTRSEPDPWHYLEYCIRTHSGPRSGLGYSCTGGSVKNYSLDIHMAIVIISKRVLSKPVSWTNALFHKASVKTYSMRQPKITHTRDQSHCRIFYEFICKWWWKISIWSPTNKHDFWLSQTCNFLRGSCPPLVTCINLHLFELISIKDTCPQPQTVTLQTPLWPRPKSCQRTPETKL